MNRRQLLVGAGTAAGVGLLSGAPAIATGKRTLRMLTDWPEGPGLLGSARRLADSISQASDGRIAIQVSPAGAVVRPLETFDAVREGVAELFHTHIGFYERHSRAFHFFSAVPFGLNAEQLFAWLHVGGGQSLLDELAGGFGVHALTCTSTGAQMGGWFRHPIDTVEDFDGLRFRMAGLGAEVYRRLGAAVVLLPADDTVKALASGAVEACEWIGPWMDIELGLHEAATHYYAPGWHEPGTALTLGIGNEIWQEFDAHDRRLFEIAAGNEYARSRAEFDTRNAQALMQLRLDGRVDIRRFPPAVLQRLAEIGETVVAEIADDDEQAHRIHASYLSFRATSRAWTALTRVDIALSQDDGARC